MERIAILLSLLVAGAVAVGSFFSFDHGGGFPHFGGSSRAADTGQPTPAGAEALRPGGVQRFAATQLEVRDAAARLTIVPEDRTDIAVEVTGGDGLPALQAALENDALVIDGELDGRFRSCNQSNDRWTIQLQGIGPTSLESAPRILVRAPRSLAVRVSGAVDWRIGPSAALHLEHDGCGDVVVGDVEGRLQLDAAGNGEVRAGRAGSAEITSRGSGDLVLGDVGGALNAVLQGSGAIRSAAVAGPADLDLRGSGDVITGAVGGPLRANLAGSGGLEVAEAQGPLVNLILAGSGNLRVADGRTERLEVRLAGSGIVDFGGVTRDLDATIAGSGNVRVRQATGNVAKSVAGSGRIVIE